MARARNIKPDFFLNEDLGHLPPLARLLFAGLWCMSDREGRLKDSPERIKIQILPYDKKVNVNKLLDLLNGEFITRYQVDGQKYIQINNFHKHQNPHKKERASELPPAPESTGKAEEKPEQAPDKHHASTVQEQEKHSTSPADSLNLIPDSLNQAAAADARAREEAAAAENPPAERGASPFQPINAEAVISLPLDDGSCYDITQSDVDAYSEQFQEIDVMEALGKYQRWLMDRPQRLPGAYSMPDKIKKWLSDERPRVRGDTHENDNRGATFVPSTGFRSPDELLRPAGDNANPG